MVWNGKTWEIFLADVIVEINLSSLLPFKNERDFLTRFKDAITIGIQAENVCVMSAKKYPCILSHQTGLVFIQLSVTRDNNFVGKQVFFTCSRFWSNLRGGALNDIKEITDISFRLFIPPDQLVISLTGIKRPQFFFCKPFRWVRCLLNSTNLPRIDCTRLITRKICANYSRNEIPRRN